MQDIDFLAVISRWIHLTSVIGLVGGTAYIRLILMPAANAALNEDQHGALREKMLDRWKVYVHAFIGLLLLSGVYNVVARWPQISKVGAYHGLLLVKIILALFVMFLASALVGRSKGLEPMRKQRVYWMTVALIVAAVIILVSGIMKTLGPKTLMIQPTSAIVAPSAVVSL